MPALSSTVKSRHWCFTSFNTGQDGTLTIPGPRSGVDYFCFQQEVCPETQKHHLQGYVCFTKRHRRSGVKAIYSDLEGAHWESTKGSPEEAIAYCSKQESAVPGTFVESGNRPSSIRGGPRNSERREGILALQSGGTLDHIREVYPSFFLQSFRAIERYIQIRDQFRPDSWSLPQRYFSWQEEVLRITDIPTTPALKAPHDRCVTWVYDQKGGMGKSTLLKIILCKFPGAAVVITSSSIKRVVEAMLPQQHVVMLDLPRDYDISKFNYSALETVKDGIGARTMYQPETKIWRNPHLIVFSNSLPERSKLTHDRWNVLNISPLHTHSD